MVFRTLKPIRHLVKLIRLSGIRNTGDFRIGVSTYTTLEEGKHAAESGMDLKTYAEASGKVRKTLSDKVLAFRVMTVADVRHEEARDNWSQLSVIHAAPSWHCVHARTGEPLSTIWLIFAG